MCESPICNAFVENLAATVVAQLPIGPNTQAAADLIRGTVSRMRCGCTGIDAPCYSTVVTKELLVDTAGVKSFVESKACDAGGMLTACARTWVTCENVPPPVCAKPCAKDSIATITFNLKNLNYACLVTKVPDVLKTVRADILAVVPGLLDGDFTCACDTAPAPTVGTQCTCEVTCAGLAILRNINFPGNLDLLKKFATLAVVPAPTLDKEASTCKIVNDAFSFGSSFELVSLETNYPQPNSASSISLVGLWIVSSISVGLVL
jgi:hypothetical protein